MKSCKGFGQPFIITCETAETVEPAKAALDHPPPGQQHEALFRFLQFDHLQFNTFIERGLRWLFARVSLYLLDLTCKLRYLGALLFVGRRHMYRQQLSQSVYRNVHLAATLA